MRNAPVQAINTPALMSNQAVFTGVIQAINGNQWTINGQNFTVAPSAIRYGTLTVGSLVKAQAVVAQDGSITITSLGPPDNGMPGINNAPKSMASGLKSAANSFAVMSTPASHDQNEEFENKITGILTAMDTNSITVNGKVYMLSSDSEVKNGLKIGEQVTLEYYAMPNGTFTVEELRSAKGSSNFNNNDNSNGNNNKNSCSDDEQDDGNNSNSNSSCDDSGGDD